jgi:hypothetical protein
MSTGQRFEMAHRALNNIASAWDYGVKALHTNEAINPIARAMLSPIAIAGDMVKRKQFVEPLTNTYLKTAAKDEAGNLVLKDGVNLANIAGSAFTVGVGAGVLGGLTHDSAGNPDIAGIPMI